MTIPEILDLAQSRVSKPLRKGGGYAVLRRNARDEWAWHTCAEHYEAAALTRSMRAAEAVRLANAVRETPWRVMLEEEARVKALHPEANWQSIARQIIERP